MKLPKLSSTYWIRLAFLVAFVVLLWFDCYSLSERFSAATRAPSATGRPPETSSVLFNAASLSLFSISVFIAVLAIFGWGAIEETIRAAVKSETAERLKALEDELRGRALALGGFVMGEISVSDDYLSVTSAERLKNAVNGCTQGYELLKSVEGAGQYMALNNLLTYSCILGEKARRGFLLEGARKLRKVGEEHDVPNLLLTSCRTILTFSLDPQEKDDACRMIPDLQADPRLNPKEKREADYLASLCEKRAGGARREQPLRG
jgi:hypothetical protein